MKKILPFMLASLLMCSMSYQVLAAGNPADTTVQVVERIEYHQDFTSHEQIEGFIEQVKHGRLRSAQIESSMETGINNDGWYYELINVELKLARNILSDGTYYDEMVLLVAGSYSLGKNDSGGQVTLYGTVHFDDKTFGGESARKLTSLSRSWTRNDWAIYSITRIVGVVRQGGAGFDANGNRGARAEERDPLFTNINPARGTTLNYASGFTCYIQAGGIVGILTATVTYTQTGSYASTIELPISVKNDY